MQRNTRGSGTSSFLKQLLRLLKPSPYPKSQEFLFRKLRSGYFRFLKCRHAQTQSALSAPDPLPAFWSGSEGLPFPVRKQPEYILFDPPDKFHRWNLLFRGGAVSAAGRNSTSRPYFICKLLSGQSDAFGHDCRGDLIQISGRPERADLQRVVLFYRDPCELYAACDGSAV